MAMPSSQFLQVPKFHRKSRSRSSSRPREIYAPSDAEKLPLIGRRPQLPPPLICEQSRTKTSNVHPDSRICDPSPSIPSHHSVPLPTASAHVSDDDSGTNYDDLIPEIVFNGTHYVLPRPPTPPPPPDPPLRDILPGTWKLDSYTAYPTSTCKIQRPTYPMTRNVTGFIMYTADGYMSAQMLIPGQQDFKRGKGEEAQWAEAGKRFFAYCGPYYISREGDEGREILRHTFQVCNLPGWVSDVQVRTWRFEEDGEVLVLGSEEPAEINGDKRIPILKWRRARDNTNGKPPPPMPQIKISGPGEP